MRTLLLTLVLAVAALAPTVADAGGPYWARTPVYINGEWVGYTYNNPVYTDTRAPVYGGTVTLPAVNYYEPPVSVTPGYNNPPAYRSNEYRPWRGYYYGNGYYYGR